MERTTELGFVKGCRVGRENVMVSHLQFEDDTIFFVESEGSSFRNLLIVLGLFCCISGLKINMGKNTILGMGEDIEIVTSLVDSVGCQVGLWPAKYLGMPLGGNSCSGAFWEPVPSKVAKRLDGWKMTFLSKGGD